MSANSKKMLESYNELLDNLRNSILLLEKNIREYAAEIERASIAQTTVMDNKAAFDLFTDLIAELLLKLKEAQNEAALLESEERLYANAHSVMIEIIQKHCDHVYRFRGSRTDEDHFVCEHCGKVEVRRAYLMAL
jgi:hypothetical protein